jgi:hypothetical protein
MSRDAQANPFSRAASCVGLTVFERSAACICGSASVTVNSTHRSRTARRPKEVVVRPILRRAGQGTVCVYKGRRVAAVTLVALAGLAVPSAAEATQTTALPPTGQLGPEGASASIAVAYACDPPGIPSFFDMTVRQSTGKRLTQYAGSVFAGLVCDSTVRTVVITAGPVASTGVFPLKQGDAAVVARLVVSTPTGQIVTAAGPQAVRLKR